MRARDMASSKLMSEGLGTDELSDEVFGLDSEEIRDLL